MSATFLPQPALGTAQLWQFPTPTRSRLDNGLEVVVFHLPGQHVVAAHLVLDVPLSAEDVDIEGVATICARTLDEGTTRHAGDAFAELLETEGAGLGVDVSLAGLQVVLDVPASRLDRALELFAEAVLHPAFDDADVHRHVQLRLAQIEQGKANSAQAANTAFRRVVLDPSTRASRMTGGEPESVARVTPTAVREFYRSCVGPAGATLILAGDFNDDPTALVERVFGGWTNPDQVRVELGTVGPAPVQHQLLDRPGSVQADVRLGGFGVDRRDPRWADLQVASYAMGGAFLSRLNAVLREDRGYTYGVRMAFGPMTVGGTFAVQGSFRTEVVAEALVEARRLLEVADPGFTEAEVADAVRFFTGVSPLRYATADGVADQAATQVLARLDPDYVTQSLTALAVVTPESATAAYRSVIDPATLSLVVVGDATLIADDVRAAGYGDLQIVDAS